MTKRAKAALLAYASAFRDPEREIGVPIPTALYHRAEPFLPEVWMLEGNDATAENCDWAAIAESLAYDNTNGPGPRCSAARRYKGHYAPTCKGGNCTECLYLYNRTCHCLNCWATWYRDIKTPCIICKHKPHA